MMARIQWWARIQWCQTMTVAGSAVTVDLDAAETVGPDPETMTTIMGPVDEAEETIEVRIEETMETPRVTGLKRS